MDERDGCRSLVCDANGIIIAEMVYRCMICSAVLDSISEAKIHYHNNHIDSDVDGIRDEPLIFPDEELSSEEEELTVVRNPAQSNIHHHSQQQHNSSSGSNNNNNSNRKTITRKPAPVAPEPIQNVRIQTQGTNGTCTIKSGYITCPVCSCTKFYTTLQRRYGQFSCVGCYRFFKEFFVKPKRYACPNLGSCPLDVRTKCKGCWIKKCIDIYTVDETRKCLLMAHRPVKKNTTGRSPNTRQQQQQHLLNGSSNSSSNNNNNNNTSCNNLNIRTNNNNNSNNNSSISPVNNDSSNENIEPDADLEGDEEPEEEESMDQGSRSNTYDSILSPPELKRIKTEGTPMQQQDVKPDGGPVVSDIAESGVNPMTGDEDEENNSLDDGEEMPNDDTENEGSSLLLPASASSYDSSSLMDGGSPPTRSGRTPPRRKTSGRIKNWCCLKCANCLADDCGKCINCLDRPKFGGPFIRKQRCLYKKCLMKTKPVPNSGGY